MSRLLILTGVTVVTAFVLSLAAGADTGAIALEAPEDDDAAELSLELQGVNYVPHVKGEGLEYRPLPTGPMGARIQFFIQNTGDETITLNEAHFLAQRKGYPQPTGSGYPIHHIYKGEWSWHDTANAWNGRHRRLPPGAMTVMTINAVTPTWTPGLPYKIRIHDWSRTPRARMHTNLERPRRWIEAVTFLGDDIKPDEVIIHVRNDAKRPMTMEAFRIWQPENRQTFRHLRVGELVQNFVSYPEDGAVPPGDMGVIVAQVDPLMLSYAAIELHVSEEGMELDPLWSHLRVKREVFDIAGGWVGGTAADGRSTLLHEPFLQTLKALHVNAGHIDVVEGYNDDPNDPDSLYAQYPIKHFHHLQPIDRYDDPGMIPHIHGAELLGEPQLPFSDQGRLPQQVYGAFQDYGPTRIPTTITLSDEAGWRLYAGLSDYPHYDAYRVIAPHADPFRNYDRWEDGVRIGWGSPMETISEMCRVLRELSRPMPTAIWSQGPHTGWYEMDGRTRLSPTPEELLSQAYFALSTRITSLYWFNLSLGSLVDFPDTLEPMQRIGREIKMLESFYLRGAAYGHEQRHDGDGRPLWELSSIAAPHGAVLFVLDLDYYPDLDDKVFRFRDPREDRFAFALPAYLRDPADVFRVDADGVHEVDWEATSDGVAVTDAVSLAAMYVAAPDADLRNDIEAARSAAIAEEEALEFDPIRVEEDLETLEAIR